MVYKNLQIKTLKNEFWVKTKESENHFVSNLGRVKSIPKIITDKNNISRRTKAKPQILIQEELKSGYLRVTINYKRYLVHRVVLNAFKEIPDGLTVNHIDFNKRNNNIDNLEALTNKENIKHYWLHYAK